MNNTETIYTCAYCGGAYETPEEAAKCILKCSDKKRAEEKKQKEKELAEQRETRRKLIAEKEKELEQIKRDYLRDYGVYYSSHTYKDELPLSYFWSKIFG